jgi:hypothetical protein
MEQMFIEGQLTPNEKAAAQIDLLLNGRNAVR